MTMLNIEYGDSQYLSYTTFCEKAVTDENLFNSFKRNPSYTYVLEHVTKELGEKYIIQMVSKYEKYLSKLQWNKIMTNDIIGNPITYDFSNVMRSYISLNSYIFSPTTLRYVYTALDILSKVTKKSIKIVEIGGGYGGQCKILFDIASLFDIVIESYTILDLKYPNMIQKKYLDRCGIEINCLTVDNYKLSEIHLLISNFALSEIDPLYQEPYKPLIVNAKSGYFLWNHQTVLKEILDKNIKTEEEIPQTGTINKIIYF
jgi:hypothetical protein